MFPVAVTFLVPKKLAGEDCVMRQIQETSLDTLPKDSDDLPSTLTVDLGHAIAKLSSTVSGRSLEHQRLAVGL